MAATVGDFVIRRLLERGVGRIYGYPGDGINGLMGALEKTGGTNGTINNEAKRADLSKRNISRFRINRRTSMTHTTWKPHTEHGKLSTKDRHELPDTAYAFPKQRKEPITDASHVK